MAVTVGAEIEKVCRTASFMWILAWHLIQIYAPMVRARPSPIPSGLLILWSFSATLYWCDWSTNQPYVERILIAILHCYIMQHDIALMVIIIIAIIIPVCDWYVYIILTDKLIFLSFAVQSCHCFDADGGWCQAVNATCWLNTWSPVTREKLWRKLFYLW